ncbi:MAG: hypothetical protein RL186_1879, partial [Pseudomonadota bacterium]
GLILPCDSGGGGREALGGGLCGTKLPLSRLRRQLPRGTGEQRIEMRMPCHLGGRVTRTGLFAAHSLSEADARPIACNTR